jgi:hypothetical protein
MPQKRKRDYMVGILTKILDEEAFHGPDHYDGRVEQHHGKFFDE